MIVTVTGSRKDRSEQHPQNVPHPISTRTARPGKTTRSNLHNFQHNRLDNKVIPSGKISSLTFGTVSIKLIPESASGEIPRRHREKILCPSECGKLGRTPPPAMTRDGPTIDQFPSWSAEIDGKARKSTISHSIIEHPGQISVTDGAPDTLSKALDTPLISTSSLLTLIVAMNVLHRFPFTISSPTLQTASQLSSEVTIVSRSDPFRD
jgi:hypothetical protein